jgi:hypothetical protein
MPAMLVKCAEPPSVVGTGGGQIAAEWPGVAAVDWAACDEWSGASPGNWSGTSEVFADEALMPAPPAPADPVLADSVVGIDRVKDPVGKVAVGTASGSAPELRVVKASGAVVAWLLAAVGFAAPVWPSV